MGYTIKEVDLDSGEVIERDMTEQEIQTLENERKKRAEEDKKVIDQINARKAVLEKLGLTEDEAKILFS
jgi:DNA-binding protein H-NS